MTAATIYGRRRVARIQHRCGHGIARNCTGTIRPGDVYRESTQYPGAEAGQADAAEIDRVLRRESKDIW